MNVARMAGIPQSVVDRANQVAEDFSPTTMTEVTDT